MSKKVSKKFVIEGRLAKGEPYNQELHLLGSTIDARNTRRRGHNLERYGSDAKLQGLQHYTLADLYHSKQEGAGRRRRKSRRVRNGKRVRKSTRGYKR
jgi:hypothetical protein